MKPPVIFRMNPDRPNIAFIKALRPPSTKTRDHLDQLLQKLVQDLKDTRQEYPLTIMYTDTDVIGYCFWYLEMNLPMDVQYIGDEVPENRVYAQYHAEYSPKMKEHIVREICKDTSKIRLVFATVALGMGLNAPSISHVIHYKPPTTLQKYFQECGRAGRDGKPARATLYYNATDIRRNKPGINKAIIDYCNTRDSCLRDCMLKFFGYTAGDRDLLYCCSVCNSTLLADTINATSVAVSQDSSTDGKAIVVRVGNVLSDDGVDSHDDDEASVILLDGQLNHLSLSDFGLQ